MAVQRASSLLLAFKAKIEESVALVPDMVAEEKLKAVQFWNVISERLQQIVNDSAADINALALNIHGEDISVVTLDDQETQAKMSQPYLETHAYRSENLYTEGFDASAEGHQQELLALSAELESPVSQAAGFSPLDQQESLTVTPKDSAVLLIATRGPDSPNFDVTPQHLPQPDYSSVLQIEEKVSFPEHKNESEGWQSCPEYVPKSKPQRKRCTSGKKSAAKGYTKRNAGLGGKRAAGAAEPLRTDSTPDACLAQNVETTEVIVVQTRKRAKKTREGKAKQCNVCLKELPNNSSLTTHMWTHERPFACTECSACFSTKNNLIVHQRSHSGEKPYACGECSASFSTRGNLKRHVKTHSGVRPWRCEQCAQCFTEKKTLVAHMRRHTGEKPYQCQVCERRFAQSGVLQTHMAVHLGYKAHLCEHCGKAFRQRSQLRLHMQRHQGLRRYSCTICPSRFLTKADLLRHERTHTGERPFVCTLCGKKFTRQQSLNEHNNRHYGIKPFECKYCDKTFAEMSACYKHIKLHSKNENGGAAQSSAKTNEAPLSTPTSHATAVQQLSSVQPGSEQQPSVAGTAELSAMDMLAAASGF